MPNAQCPMPNAPCPMPHAQCPILYDQNIKGYRASKFIYGDCNFEF
ncbi:hypothetical protein [Nostoc sp.]